ncbi:universal stress protein [Streptomyces mirabilis]|uniref:universal stress protein n=1 Tax=Streptomyces mirabilis TaxID=68239 RepID=UPI0036580208
MGEGQRRRVVVGVSGSPGSLAALHRGAFEAHRTGAVLLAVGAWEPPRGALAHPSSMLAPPMTEFRQMADDRLLTALDTAFGADGPGVPCRGLVVWDRPGRALVRTADRLGDLLVIGGGRRGRMRRALFPSVARYCLAHAACPVLAVPRSPLHRELASVRRRVSLRLPLDASELTDGRS